MPTPEPKRQENPGNHPRNTTDLDQKNKDTNPAEDEAKKQAEKFAEKKTDTKKESATDRTGEKLNILRTKVNPDKDTVATLNALDTNKDLESPEQQKSFEMLQTVTATSLLAIFFKNGGNIDDIQKIEDVHKIGSGIITQFNAAEMIALKKIKEIAGKSGSKIYEELNKNWNKLVQRGKDLYTYATDAKSRLEQTKSPHQSPVSTDNKPVENEKDASITDKIIKFASENKLLTAGLVIAGSYGIYKIFEWLSDKFEEFTGSKKDGKSGEGESFIEKILGKKWFDKAATGLKISAGILVLGRLIGNEDIGKWVKDNIGVNLTGNRLSQFVVLMSEGKFIEAFKVMFEGPDENYEIHKKMAESISKEMGTEIKPETLKNLGGVKYEDFMSLVAQGKSVISGILAKIPGANIITGALGDIEQEQILRKYFEKNEAEINHFKNPTTTVDQVLMKLAEKTPGVASTGAEKGKEDSANAPKGVPTIAIPSGLESAVNNLDTPEKKAMGAEILKDLQKLLPESEIAKIIAVAKKLGINTEPVEKLMAERKQALDELQKALESKASKEIIAEKSAKLFGLNDKLCGEFKNSVDTIMQRKGWTEAAILGVTHAPKFIDWFMQPAWKKEYGKYLLSKYIQAPIEAVRGVKDAIKGTPSSELIGKQFKEGASSIDIETEVKETKYEIETAKKNQIEYDKEAKFKLTDDAAQTAAELNKSKTALLEKDLQIHEKRAVINKLETDLTSLKASNAPADEIAKVEKALEDNKSLMNAYKQERIKIQGEYLELRIRDQRLIFTKEFGTDGRKALLSKGYIEQMDGLQTEINNHRKQVDLEIAKRMEEAEKLAKEGKDVKALAADINELRRTRIRLDLGAVDNYQKLAKSWTKTWELYHALNGDSVTANAQEAMKQEKNEMQRLWSKMMDGQVEGKGAGGAESVLHTVKGKVYFYGAFFAFGTAINLYDRREGEDWTKSLGQAAVDVLPFVSTYSDFRAAATGEEWITKRKLDSKDRALRAMFGVGSGLCDLTQFAGVAMRMRGAAGALKEARATGKSLEMAEVFKAAQKEGKAIDSIEALRTMSETGSWVNKLAFTGALGALGYGLIHSPVASVELAPETLAILGPDKVQDHKDINPPPHADLIKAP